MRGSSLRQTLLTDNLANVNTPGYQRKDVDFHAALASAMETGERLERRRVPADDRQRARRARRRQRHRHRQESAELAKNALEYQALVSVAGTRTNILQTAMGVALMGLFDAIDVAGSGLAAERLRMDVTAGNLANAQTTRAPNGSPYRRHEVVLQRPAAELRLDASRSTARRRPTACRSPASSRTRRPRRVYDPGHPDADAQGYVTLPNVNPVTEMVDLICASRSLRGERDRDADRQAAVLEDAGAAQMTDRCRQSAALGGARMADRRRVASGGRRRGAAGARRRLRRRARAADRQPHRAAGERRRAPRSRSPTAPPPTSRRS